MAETDSSSLEDYMRTLYELADVQGKVHAVDVARALAVSKPSVHRAVALLADRGYVVAAPYAPIALTAQGRIWGEKLQRRYEAIYGFLVRELGVAPDVAAEEAHGVEHALSAATTDRWLERYES